MATKELIFIRLRNIVMSRAFIVSTFIIAGMLLTFVFAHSDHSHISTAGDGPVQASGGENIWNMGTEPNDPWKAIEQMHGHVGPWNVLGWKIGKKALADFNTSWGRHELDITVYIPMDTPYSCLADGVIIGTGNSLGRLNIRVSPVPKMEMVCVEVRKATGAGPTILYKPKFDYMHKILVAPEEAVHTLSHECFEMDNAMLFDQERIK